MLVTSWQKIEPEAMNDKITRQMLSGDHATIARIFLAKGAVVPRHSHPSEQFSLILSGALRFLFDDREVIVREGEIVYILSNEPHAAEALEDTWDIDFFAPRREDWISRDDAYLRTGVAPAGKETAAAARRGRRKQQRADSKHHG